MTDLHVTAKQDEYDVLINSATYTLDLDKYKQLERFPVLYDSLMHLLSALAVNDSSSDEIDSIVSILEHFNCSFFEFIESIEVNYPIE